MHYGVVQLQIINRELPTLQNEPTNCKIEMFFMLQECADLCKPLAQFRPQERKSIPTHDLSESVLSVFMLFPLLPHRTISASVIFDPDHVFIHFFSHLFFFFSPPGFLTVFQQFFSIYIPLPSSFDLNFLFTAILTSASNIPLCLPLSLFYFFLHLFLYDALPGFCGCPRAQYHHTVQSLTC